MCNAAVPEVALTTWCPPVASETAASKSSTMGPVVSQSPRSTASTASMSSSETDCRPYGITAGSSDPGRDDLADRLDGVPLVIAVGPVEEPVLDGDPVGRWDPAPRAEIWLHEKAVV